MCPGLSGALLATAKAPVSLTGRRSRGASDSAPLPSGRAGTGSSALLPPPLLGGLPASDRVPPTSDQLRLRSRAHFIPNPISQEDHGIETLSVSEGFWNLKVTEPNRSPRQRALFLHSSSDLTPSPGPTTPTQVRATWAAPRGPAAVPCSLTVRARSQCPSLCTECVLTSSSSARVTVNVRASLLETTQGINL